MLRKVLPILLAALLLKAPRCLAQSQSAPVPPSTRDSDYEQVSVPVPRAVTLITDVVRVLPAREPT